MRHKTGFVLSSSTFGFDLFPSSVDVDVVMNVIFVVCIGISMIPPF